MELHFTNVGGTWADENTAMQVKSEGSPRLDTEQFGQRQAGKTVQRLKEAIAAARVTSNSEKLRAVRNLRDKSLAHLLEQTREEIQRTVMPVKYGDERDLINETIKIVDGLMLGILGSRLWLGEFPKNSKQQRSGTLGGLQDRSAAVGVVQASMRALSLLDTG